MTPSMSRQSSALLRAGLSTALALGASFAMVSCKRRTENNAPPAVGPSMMATWGTNAVAFRGRLGTIVTVTCVPGRAPGAVWGSDLYSDDSSICSAALHSGRVSLQGGTVQIQINPGATLYAATMRNGVVSRPYRAWPGSFTIVGGPAPGLIAVPIGMGRPMAPPPPAIGMGGGGGMIPVMPGQDPWSINATRFRGQFGSRFSLVCTPGGTPRTVWGSMIYSDDSSVCTAAVHASRLDPNVGGMVTVMIQAGMPGYPGSVRNGITSVTYGAYAGSYVFVSPVVPMPPTMGGTPPGATPLAWSDNAIRFRGQNGIARRVWCPPNGTRGSVWGTGIYTDDSSVCNAAVHAGRISMAMGGAFTVRNMPGLPAYRGSASNGITTMNYATFPGSFALAP